MTSPAPLHPTTRRLHWLIALPFIGLCLMGVYMTHWEDFSWYWTHKSLGVLLFAPIMARVLWRCWQGWPQPLNSQQALQNRIARAVHYGLLLGTLLMPISGMLHSGASGHGFGLFTLQLIASNPAPNPADGVVPFSPFWTAVGQGLHQWVGYCLLGLIALHVAGALKHHFVNKDATLRRMLGR